MEGSPAVRGPKARGDTPGFGGIPWAWGGQPRHWGDSPALGVPGTAAASGPSSGLSRSREDAPEVSPSHGSSSLRSRCPSPKCEEKPFLVFSKK